MKLAKHPDVIGFLVANLSVDHKAWIGSLPYSAEAQQRYTARQKRLESLSYTVVSEASKVSDDFEKLFQIEDRQHPELLQAFLRGDACLETLIVLDDLVGYSKTWKKITDPIMSQVTEQIEKLRPFLTYDRESIRAALLKKFTQ